MLSISHCSCYSACFRRHRGSAPLSEVRQKLSPSCLLASWLELSFEQCRNAVKMTAWFLHLACHSELPRLVRRRFIPSAFPWYQHLCIQLCSTLNWLMPWCSTDPLLSNPSLRILANTHPAPGCPAMDPNSLMDTGRASGERGGPRNRHPCWKAKADIVGRGSSESAVGAACWLLYCTVWMESGHRGVSILWFWLSFALNPKLRKKLAQQQLASLSNPLCTGLSSGKGLSNPLVGTPRARLHAWGQISALC